MAEPASPEDVHADDDKHTAFFYGTHHNFHHGAKLTSPQAPWYLLHTPSLPSLLTPPKMVPDIFHTVCYSHKDQPASIRSRHTFHPAILHGFTRRRVRYADYPGIFPDATGSVRGVYVTGLSRANLASLDAFEGSQYERRTVTVKLLAKAGDAATGEGNVEGEERVTGVYVFLEEGDLEGKEWDFDEFRRERMGSWTRAGFVFDGE